MGSLPHAVTEITTTIALVLSQNWDSKQVFVSVNTDYFPQF